MRVQFGRWPRPSDRQAVQLAQSLPQSVSQLKATLEQSPLGQRLLAGIPFTIVLGIIAGVLNFIPNLGPYLAIAPALLVAFPQGATQALYVIALYMGVQSLEGYVLTPLLDKKFVSVSPALLLSGRYCWAF